MAFFAHHPSVMRKSKMSINGDDDVTTLTLMVEYDNIAQTIRKIAMRNISQDNRTCCYKMHLRTKQDPKMVELVNYEG